MGCGGKDEVDGGDCCGGWQVSPTSVADRAPPKSATGKSYASTGVFGVK